MQRPWKVSLNVTCEKEKLAKKCHIMHVTKTFGNNPQEIEILARTIKDKRTTPLWHFLLECKIDARQNPHHHRRYSITVMPRITKKSIVLLD